jgi:hypothetical protein
VPTSLDESSLPEDKNDNIDSEAREHIPLSPEPITPEEDQLPPEAQGEVNGGPLGCCLGTTIGLVLSVSIALLSRFYADPLAHLLGGALSIVTRILMVLVAIVGVLICGYFGWRIGKYVYREYNLPNNS